MWAHHTPSPRGLIVEHIELVLEVLGKAGSGQCRIIVADDVIVAVRVGHNGEGFAAHLPDRGLVPRQIVNVVDEPEFLKY